MKTTKALLLIFIFSFLTACAVKHPIIQASDEDGYYNTDNSLSGALRNAAKETAMVVNSNHEGGELAVITISKELNYIKVQNEVLTELLKAGVPAYKIENNYSKSLNDYENILTVYPVIYGIEHQFKEIKGGGCVLPKGPAPGFTGRDTKVTIYARLENRKSGIIKLEKEISATVAESADLSIQKTKKK